MLFAEEVGNGPPVVAVHGFTQTHRSWRPVTERLSPLYRFTLVDAPGHGGSGDIRADLWRGADLLAEAGGAASYLGYSLGARLCLHAALRHPEAVRTLILVGSHPGIVDPVERARRHADDDARAGRLKSDGVDRFLEGWLGQPLFSTLSVSDADRRDRATNSAAGLASSLRLAGTGSQEPLWARLAELAMPVLLVAGELDVKFGQLGREAARAIGRNAELVLIPGAGHACHLERPDAFCLVLADFLADAGA